MKKLCIILLTGMMACSSSSKIKKTTTVAPTTPVEVATIPVTPVDPELEKAMIKVPGITAERLAEGQKVYMQDCTRCHAMKDPANYTPIQWEPILVRMFANAKLTDDHEKTLIRDYVMAKSK